MLVAADTVEAERLGFSAAHMVAQMKFLRRAPEKVERFMRAVVRSVFGSLPLGDAPHTGLERLHSEGSVIRPDKPARHQA